MPDLREAREAPTPFAVRAADGFAIKGLFWRRPEGDRRARPVVIINPATSVRCRYYARFAAFLFREGLDVICYDYRGIGESRPATLRGFEAGWLDWGSLDFDAIVRHAALACPGQPVHVVGHSIGGFLIGLAGSSHAIGRVFTVGAQFAYWRDYAPASRAALIAKWHIAMPLLTLLFGYFPGRRLGWLEDTPKGVVRDWVLSHPRFEDKWRGRAAARTLDRHALVLRFAAVTAPMLAVSLTDDEFGTIPAIERALAYFTQSPRQHLRISPEAIGAPSIGHFGFFHSRFERTLWPLALEWLRFGRLRADCPGTRIAPERSECAHAAR
jgi:predicted alpha/beta hydrolase